MKPKDLDKIKKEILVDIEKIEPELNKSINPKNINYSYLIN